MICLEDFLSSNNNLINKENELSIQSNKNSNNNKFDKPSNSRYRNIEGNKVTWFFGHQLYKFFIEEWFIKSETCPICR